MIPANADIGAIIPIVAPQHFLCYSTFAGGTYYWVLVAPEFEKIGTQITSINLDGTHGVDVKREGRFQGVTVTSKLKFANSSHVACLAIIVTNSKSRKVYLSSLREVKERLNLTSITSVSSDFETNFYSVSRELWALSEHYFCLIHGKRNWRKHLRDNGILGEQKWIILHLIGQFWLDVASIQDLRNQYPVKILPFHLKKIYYCGKKI